jgi:hypothetical protein
MRSISTLSMFVPAMLFAQLPGPAPDPVDTKNTLTTAITWRMNGNDRVVLERHDGDRMVQRDLLSIHDLNTSSIRYNAMTGEVTADCSVGASHCVRSILYVLDMERRSSMLRIPVAAPSDSELVIQGLLSMLKADDRSAETSSRLSRNRANDHSEIR